MLKNILLIIVIMVGAIGNTNAAVSGFAGRSKNGPPTCPNSVMGNPLSGTQVWSFSGNLCTMGSPGYVPSSGYYFAQTDIMRNFSLMYSFKSNSAYIDGSKPVKEGANKSEM